jgi:hypothetical protein
MAKVPKIITMGQTTVKIKTDTNAIANRIKKLVQQDFLNPWLTGLKIATEAASQRFVEMLEKTEVIKALNNEYKGEMSGKDLPAEFGLYRDISKNEIVPAILDVSKKSFGAHAGGGNLDRSRSIFGVVNIGLDGLYVKNLIQDVPHAEYESKGGTVPWMRWLLAGSAENDDYGIVYYPSGIPEGKKTESRSRYATMSSSKSTGWFWNADVLGVYGNNFVEDVMRNPQNMAIFNREIIKGIKQAFSRSTKLNTTQKKAIVIT